MRLSILHGAVVATLLLVLCESIVITAATQQASKTINSQGSVVYWPRVDISVDLNDVIGTNNLSLGLMFDWERWIPFVDQPTSRQLVSSVGFKLIRVFDFRKISSYGYPDLMPCVNWNESSKTGRWNWTSVDLLTQKIFEVGAEPLFCLGWARDNIQSYIPSGMSVNPSTQLPYPESYAAYAAEWVKHFKNIGLPVRYYQIMNEPNFYFGWNPSDTTKLSYYVELWNLTARAMRAENQMILLSQDCIKMKRVMDYWLLHGDNIDFLDFHKYDADSIGQYTDAEMFNRAETIQFETTTSFYGVDEARQRWFNSRGKWLPVINSESNFNSAYQTGTDPKIQQMSGSVWLALVTRMGMLKGLSYSVYFEFSSSKSWQQSHGTGWGFGMTNKDDNQQWYPYYVAKIIGSNLAVGDKIVDAISSSGDVRCIAWVHSNQTNILLICKVPEKRTVIVEGFDGQANLTWIDGTVSYEAPRTQQRIITHGEGMYVDGYTVALLQTQKP